MSVQHLAIVRGRQKRVRSVRTLALCATALALVATGPAFAGPDINVSQTVKTSTLGSGDTPNFNGGTLLVDSAGPFAQNFTMQVGTTGAATVSTLDENGKNVTFSGVFSDGSSTSIGSIVFADSVGGGKVTLTGVSTYTGTTTINSGATLALGGTGSIALSTGMTDNGTFDISATSAGASITSLSGSGNVILGSQVLGLTAASGTFSGVISGTSGIVVSAGTEVLSGANTYTGGTAITGGTLQIGAGGTTGSIVGNVSDAGTFAISRSDTVSFGGTITGVGGFSQLGTGTLILTNADTYTGPTNVASGTLQLSSTGSITGSSQVTVTGVFDISPTAGASIKSLGGTGTVQLGSQTLTLTAASGTFSGTILGSGGITVTGGTQTLTGLESYTGATTVSGGILRLGSSAVSNNISDTATVSFFSNTTVAMSGVISGTGQVTQTGNGVTTISAAQTYTGATTISLGTLALSGTGSIARSSNVEDDSIFDISGAGAGGASIQSLSGSGTVTLGSQNLTLSNASGSFSGNIAGTGGIILASGNETLTSTSTFTGQATVVSGATLFLTSTSALSTASRVADNGTMDLSGVTTSGLVPAASIQSLSGSGIVALGSKFLQLTNAGDTFAGTISGTGGLTISGGVETLTGSNTYTGATTISAGILAIAGNGSISSAGTVTDNGTFDISAATSTAVSLGALSGSGTVTLGAKNLNIVTGGGNFAGTISGTGSLTISGGTQILSGSNSYSGGTVIAAGTLQLGNNNAGGSLAGNVTDNGTLAFARTDTAAFNGVISGSGGVTQLGTGTTALTAANTYTGTTLISAGTLQLGNGGTSGSIIGNVTDNGTLGFNRSDATSFGGTIQGTGGISLAGTGSVTLTPVESYTGTTTISNVSKLIIASGGSIATSSDVIDNGVLDISAVATPQLASLGGSGSVLTGGHTLTLTNGVDTFSGALSGAGGLTVTGGNQILSGTNSYTGATLVSGGKLTVNGAIATSSGVTVNSGGTLAGSGTTSAVNVSSGGTLAPGAGLTINGGLTMASGSAFTATLSSTTTTKATVNGTAAIAGTLSVSNGGGSWLLGQKQTVLSATGGVSGTFTVAPITSTGAQYASAVSYDANDVYVTVNLSKLSPLLPTGANVNAAAPIAGIDAALAKGDTAPTALQGLANLTSAQLGTAAPQLGGEIGADVSQAGAAMMSPFIDTMTDHQVDRSGGRVSFWATGYSGSDLVNGNSIVGSHKFKEHAAGLVLGMDRTFGKGGLTLGGALSFGSGNFHLNGADGNGSADTIQGGVYGTIHTGRMLYGQFAVALASDTLSTRRSVTTASTDTLIGHGKMLVLGGRYEEGVNLGWFTPYAAIDDKLVRAPDYTETASSGASTFALHYGSRSSNFADLDLGVRQRSETQMDRDWTLVLSDQLAWKHTLSGVWDGQANFASLPDSTFTTLGAQPTKDAGLIAVGAELRDCGFNVNLHAESQVGRNSQSYTVLGGLGFTW
jgi:autotransporter-associated beta strand protein